MNHKRIRELAIPNLAPMAAHTPKARHSMKFLNLFIVILFTIRKVRAIIRTCGIFGFFFIMIIK